MGTNNPASYNEIILWSLQVPEVSITDTDYPNIFPAMIQQAELRIYRELDFLTTIEAQTATCAASSRNIAIPDTIIIVREVNVITPATSTVPDNGKRNPLRRVSLAYMNAAWPSPATNTGVPTIYTLLDNVNARFAPTPDQTYTAEFIGTFRPDLLAADNPNTYISDNMPDLLLAATLKFIFQYQQESDMAQLWEQQYQTLRAGVDVENLRQKAASVSWTPYQPTPQANVSRERATPPAGQG